MAIKKGLTPRMAEVGKIKIGGKSTELYTAKSGRKYRAPVKYCRFVITTTQRDRDGHLIVNEVENDKIAKNPRELRIRLPFDSIDKNFFTEYQMYGGKKRLCHGNGEYATRTATQDGKVKAIIEKDARDDDNKEFATLVEKEIDVKAGDIYKIKCDPLHCQLFLNGKCKVCGILSAFLTDSRDYGAIYRFRTHSINSVSNILAALNDFSANTGGILQGLPLKMIMLKKTTEEHGDIDTVTLLVDGDTIMGLRNLALQEKESRLRLGVNIKLIEDRAEQSGFFIDNEDPETIQGEFYEEDDEEKTEE